MFLCIGDRVCLRFAVLTMRTPTPWVTWERRFASTVLWAFFAAVIFRVIMRQ